MRRARFSRTGNLTQEYVVSLCAEGNEKKKEAFEQAWNMPKDWEKPYLEKLGRFQAAQRANWFNWGKGRKATKMH